MTDHDHDTPLERRTRCVLCSADVTNKPARAARNRTPAGLVWVGPVCLACWGEPTGEREARR